MLNHNLFTPSPIHLPLNFVISAVFGTVWVEGIKVHNKYYTTFIRYLSHCMPVVDLGDSFRSPCGFMKTVLHIYQGIPFDRYPTHAVLFIYHQCVMATSLRRPLYYLWCHGTTTSLREGHHIADGVMAPPYH